jgi:hypothetical protein
MINFAPGHAYYRLGFLDNRQEVIDIKSFIFFGKNLFDDPQDTWYFQDPGSFAKFGPIVDAETDACQVNAFRKDELRAIYDLNGLRSELGKYA